MNRVCCILMMLLYSVTLCCAELTISGTITTQQGESIKGASVRVTNSDNKILAYAISNTLGKYTITLNDTLPRQLCITYSCIGYKKIVRTIECKDVIEVIDIQLQEENFEIEEVIVKAPAIKRIGDTIQYNVGAFASQADRSIEDVIKRLPGIQVDNSGRIFYNGEAINKFYIEDMDLLGGRYAIATQNINADEIATVSIYENHQPKQVLKDVVISDRAALNLRLKDKSKLRPIGYAHAGGGYGEGINWLGELFGMQTSEKNQTIVTAKGNNTGNTYIHETQLLTDNKTDETVAYNIFTQHPFGTINIPTSRYYRNTSASTSVNTLFKIDKHLKIRAYADYSYENNNYLNEVEIGYMSIDNASIRVVESNCARLNNHIVNVNFNIENNNNRSYISNDLALKGRFCDNTYNVNNNNILQQSLNNNDYHITNEFAGIFKNGRNIFDVKSLISFGSTPHNEIVATIPATDSLIVTQIATGMAFHTLESTSYSWLISQVSLLGIEASFEVFYDRFSSQNNPIPTPSRQGNEVSGYKIVTSVVPFYQLKNEHLTWRTEIPVRMYDLEYRNIITGAKHPLHKPYIDIKSSLYFNLFGSIKTTLSIGRDHTIGNIQDYITTPIYTTYRQQIALGTGNLGIRSNNYISLSANYRNSIEGIFASLRTSYNVITSNEISTTSITADEVIYGHITTDNKGSNANLFFNLSKNQRNWNTTFTLSGGAIYLKRMTQRESQLLNVKTQNYSIGADIHSTFWNERISGRVNLRYGITSQTTDMQTDNTNLHDWLLTAELSVFPVSSLEIFYTLHYNKSDLATNSSAENIFMDSGIRYKDKDWIVELRGKNLTNAQVYSYSYINNYDTYTYSCLLRPIEFILSFQYSF